MRTLYLQPVGPVHERVIVAIEQRIRAEYDVDVVTLSEMPVPGESYDQERQQYSSSVMMQRLAAMCPDEAVRLFGLTECDLFIPMLSFVFGQAQLNGRIALISLARLRQEFYGLPEDGTVVMERAAKETLHELGHTFGLIHCLDKECPMSLSTSIQLLDNKGGMYCPSCSLMLRGALRPGKLETRP